MTAGPGLGFRAGLAVLRQGDGEMNLSAEWGLRKRQGRGPAAAHPHLTIPPEMLGAMEFDTQTCHLTQNRGVLIRDQLLAGPHPALGSAGSRPALPPYSQPRNRLETRVKRGSLPPSYTLSFPHVFLPYLP